jgi:hypothetical protein
MKLNFKLLNKGKRLNKLKFLMLSNMQIENYNTKIHNTLDSDKLLIEIYPN